MVQQAGGEAASTIEPRSVGGLVRASPDLTAIVVMAIIGIAISVYLTTVHYAGTPLVCSTGGVINCNAVTTSSYSVVPGTQLPITIPGLLWFVVSGALALATWRAQLRDSDTMVNLCLAQVVWGAVGLVTVLYLIYAEIVKLHAICEWCTGVHILTILTFLIALLRLQRVPLPEED